MKEIVAGVRKHALDNYNYDGWDFLVECYGDDDIERILKEDGVTTLEDAIKVFGEFLGIKDEQRRNIQAEVF